MISIDLKMFFVELLFFLYLTPVGEMVGSAVGGAGVGSAVGGVGVG